MTRRELREHVFNELFTSDFYLSSEEDLMAQRDLYFTHAGGDGLDLSPDEVPEEEQDEVKEKTAAALEEKAEDIKEKISGKGKENSVLRYT